MNHKYIFYYIKYTMIALTYKDFGVLHDDFTEILTSDSHIITLIVVSLDLLWSFLIFETPPKTFQNDQHCSYRS